MRLLALVLLTLPLPAMAQDQDLAIANAVVPLAPPGAMAHAAYLTITNTGDDMHRLIGVSAQGYDRADIHQSAEVGGVSTMLAIDAIEIAGGQTVVFERLGLHVMLTRPAEPVHEGDTVPLTFAFADGATLQVAASVKRMRPGP